MELFAAADLGFAASAALDSVAACVAAGWVARGPRWPGQAPGVRFGALPEVSVLTLR